MQRYQSSSSWEKWVYWDCWSNDLLTVATDYKIISKISNTLSKYIISLTSLLALYAFALELTAESA